MNDIIHEADEKTVDRITEAFLKMKKFDLEEIERLVQKHDD